MSWTKYGRYGLFCNILQFKNVFLIVYSRRVRYSSKEIYLLQKDLMKLLNTCNLMVLIRFNKFVGHVLKKIQMII